MSRAGEPILEAYLQTSALLRACPQCRAAADEFCIDPRGRLRRVPCVLRSAARLDADGPVEPSGGFPSPRSNLDGLEGDTAASR